MLPPNLTMSGQSVLRMDLSLHDVVQYYVDPFQLILKSGLEIFITLYHISDMGLKPFHDDLL